MAVKTNGKNFSYNIGKQSWTPSQLSNNMSGTDANAIYYATHGGTGNANMTGGANPGAISYSSNNGGSGGSGGGSRSGSSSTSISASSSGGYGGGGGYDYAGMIQSMLDQQRAAAQAAYDASRARLDEAWGNTQGALQSNLDSALGQLKANYQYGQDVANKDAAKSLREAYVNYMMNRRNLNQNLSAMGLSGGATESNLARMYNNYGSSRNGINETLANNLAELLNTYNNNVASAEQAYNSQYADAMNNYIANLNQLEQALASNMMGSYSGSSLTSLANYASTLAGLQNGMAQAAEAYTPTQNTLEVNNVSSTQGTDLGSVTDYAKYQAMANQMANQGASNAAIIQQLANAGAGRDMIYQLFGAA